MQAGDIQTKGHPMKTTTITYPSSDGASTIHARLWEPDGSDSSGTACPGPRGVVQIVHGMSEHIGRYTGFAEFLCAAGFIVCAEDHVGHGKTAATADDLGHIPLRGGEDILIEDVHTLRELVQRRCAAAHGSVPYIIFGHSMGSFITRVYLTRHGDGVAAAIICGTGQQAAVLTAAGKVLCRAIALVRGERHRSKLVDSMGAGAFNKDIQNPRTSVDWISTDPAVADAYVADPLCGQVFTVGGYHTLSAVTADSQKAALTARIPKDLPMLFIAGAEDPVGEHGAAVHRAVEQYRSAGIGRVDETIYPGVRHEILNEPIKGQVMADILAWVEALGL